MAHTHKNTYPMSNRVVQNCPVCDKPMKLHEVYQDDHLRKPVHIFYTCTNKECYIAAICTHPKRIRVKYNDNTPTIYQDK